MTETVFDSSQAFTPFDLAGDAAGAPVVINPDDYLEAEFGREFTPERSRQAWAQAYERLSAELARPKDGVHVYLVMGVQGAGKSRWVSENLGRLGPRAVVFDAALPARRHRERLLEITRAHGVPVIAIFVKAALDLALSRNASRSVDKRVPEDAVRSVFGMLEAPVVEEGFVRVQEVDPGASLPDVLETARLRLVPPKVELAQKLADALNASYELHRDFLEWSKPHWTLEDTQLSLHQAAQDFETAVDEKRYFVLERSHSAELVGCIGLTPRTEQPQGFEIGYWASQRHAGKGRMTEALTALVSQLSEHALYLTVSSANIPSQRLAEAAGFVRTETIPQARVSGRHGLCDTVVYRRAAR
jgi:RimJ/RimL family protein N-acetyltransferase